MAEATSSTSSARPTIVLFGDSLTEYSFDRLHNKGFGQIVTEYFKDKAEVINEG
jgi:lysophospholipase L1-like esterase